MRYRIKVEREDDAMLRWRAEVFRILPNSTHFAQDELVTNSIYAMTRWGARRKAERRARHHAYAQATDDEVYEVTV